MSKSVTFNVVDQGEGLANCRITFDVNPPKTLIDRVIESIGENARDAMKVEVQFGDLLNESKFQESTWWGRSGLNSVAVPLGPRGAHDVQFLELGAGLAHHALIVGRPGSGKTNLMHVIITSLALGYSPDELELYLIDFKKGVGFKAYAEKKLPHARVVAIESEREFGISVLRGLDKELTRRGELFRSAGGAEKLSDYRNTTKSLMSRIVLVADEFQEFFSVDDAISRESAMLFDRIVRQGRAFGIHIILGTQTLGSSDGLKRGTIDQISVRIALQCSDADSRQILGDDNPGARFLSRPGEAIYNAENGSVQANKLFQVAIFSEDDKEHYLTQVREKAQGKYTRLPVIFEGDMPANLQDSPDVIDLLAQKPRPNLKKGVDAWLGEPIAIKTPNASIARFRRQAGANLLLVTRDEEQGIGLVSGALVSLAIQHADHTARFLIADYSTADSDWSDFAEDFDASVPHESRVVPRRQVPDVITDLLHEVEVRQNQDSPPTSNLFFVVIGLQRSRELRKEEDDYTSDAPADKLLKVMREGPEVGVHTIIWADTVSSLTRTLDRKALREFGLRVAGVMTNEDSTTLLDDSSAARIDRPHRVLLYDEERPGALEKLRPYGIPSKTWIEKLGPSLSEDD